MNETARIYNLFPRLLGPIPNWLDHIPRIAKMRFNWIFLNPVQYSGFSGSLYSIKNYYKLNPLFFDPQRGQEEMEQLKEFLDNCHNFGLKVMMDLVVNHTAVDHPFTKEHSDWYKWEETEREEEQEIEHRNERGEITHVEVKKIIHKDKNIKNPGAWDGDNWVSWGDLAEIDNEASPDRDNLWKYWLDMVLYYLDLGFDGFRCDAAYKLPAEFWSYIIKQSKEKHPETIWFAESLGCPLEDTISLGDSGFQYTFNSSKWWDYKEDWCYDQYVENQPHSLSISFPESHDTERCMSECEAGILGLQHKYLFTALFSAGVMITLGYEFGFRKRVSVVESYPEHYESEKEDISYFIYRVNTLKSSYQLFNEESYLNRMNVDNEHIAVLVKTSLNLSERALLVLNKNFAEEETIRIEDYLTALNWDKGQIQDISLDDALENCNDLKSLTLKPGEIKIFYSKR